MESSEFKCVCNEGFSGTRCENKCPLKCENNGNCTLDGIKEGIKQWKCLCSENFSGLHFGFMMYLSTVF